MANYMIKEHGKKSLAKYGTSNGEDECLTETKTFYTFQDQFNHRDITKLHINTYSTIYCIKKSNKTKQ